MEIQKTLRSAFTGLLLGLSSADKLILKNMLNDDPTGTLTATHATQYAPSKLLQGFQKGEINEEYRIWFYKVLAKADEIAMGIIDGATGKSQRELLNEEMEQRGGPGIENIIPCKPIKMNELGSNEYYYPVRTNGTVESISDQLYIRTINNNGQKVLEFHVDIHKYKNIYDNLKTRGPIVNELMKTTEIEYDIVKFDNELSTYVDIPCNYSVKYSDFCKSENSGFFIIKYLSI